ncbi:MAG: HDOD domain-containing protein [Desulfobacterales bacterium]|nr:HDOD domain-containing protein [Desulfobacterales bacterium]
MAFRSEIVPIGELRVSADTSAELVTVTASCVALVLYEAENHVAGMLHVVLPGRRNMPRDDDRKTYFADTGVPMLIEEMIKHGAGSEKMKASIIGGGMLLADSKGADIGRRNTEAVTGLLKKQGIPIVRKDVGGNIGRRITVSVATGRINIRQNIQKTERLTANDPPQRFQNGILHFSVDSLKECRNEILAEARGFSAKISFRHSFESVSCFSDKMKDAFQNLESLMTTNDSIIKPLLHDLANLRPNPTWSDRLMEAVHQPVTDWGMVLKIISRDPVLAMHFFRITNSPYYGKPRKISSFEKALSFLGPEHLRRICVLASVAGAGNPSDKYEISESMLPQHCLATGAIAQYLAADMPPGFREDVLTAGLLHDTGIIGLTVLSMKNSNDYSKSSIFDQPSIIGALILSKWKLPEHIVEAVFFHNIGNINKRAYPQLGGAAGNSPLEGQGGVFRGHDRLSECEQHPGPPQGGNPPTNKCALNKPDLAALIHIGCWISRLLGISSTLIHKEYTLSPEAMNQIGLHESLHEILANVFSELKSKGLLEYLNLDLS